MLWKTVKVLCPRLRECNRAGLAQRTRIDRFIFEYDITATIEAATQAEAEAKLLAEPALLDFSDFDDFDVSFRAGRSDNYIRVHPGCASTCERRATEDRCAQRRDTKSWEPLSVIHVILTDKRA